MEERFGVAEQLLEAVRNGIDAAKYYARFEGLSGMTSDDAQLVELAAEVEEAATNLDDAMMALLDYMIPELEDQGSKAN